MFYVLTADMDYDINGGEFSYNVDQVFLGIEYHSSLNDAITRANELMLKLAEPNKTDKFVETHDIFAEDCVAKAVPLEEYTNEQDTVLKENQEILTTIRTLCKKYDFLPNYYIDKSNNVNQDYMINDVEEIRTGTKGIRIATLEDYDLLRMILDLKNGYIGDYDWDNFEIEGK